MAQYSKFLGAAVAPDDNLVQSGVNWYDAARYCNWLSQAEGVPHDQWCYTAARSADGGEILESAECFATRTGYRLRTEAEWDYACRAGTITPRYFGNAAELLPKYAWYYVNSGEKRHAAGLLKPNDWGLFDLYGNVWEWCHDVAVDGATPTADGPAPAPEHSLRGAPYTARPWFLFSSWRSTDAAITRDELIGFRVARTMPGAESAEGAECPIPDTSPSGASLRVIRSGVYTFNAWYHQTGVRRSRYANYRQAGTGFRVARTFPTFSSTD
ncbi:MAG TPA: formylglycine-generating enzyme family protein [Pirellulales bacterium]|nr:formylglycine-generating enzyme family protein [Pirellulales bacterium]